MQWNRLDMEMKTSLAALGAALLLTSPWQAFAASSVDLTVSGLIVPSACTPTLSGNGVVDHGKLSAKDLKVDEATKLNDATLQLTVNCDAQTLFALQGVDNRAGSASDPAGAGYGLNLINGTQKLGFYHLRLLNPLADSVTTIPLASIDNGNTWTEATGATWPPRQYAGFGEQNGGTWAPIPIQELITDLQVMTYIAPTQDLDLTNEVQIDGSATLEVKYL